MSHAIYQTPAFILATRTSRESSKYALMYTRDFGLIYIHAQSIRELQSKMKYHLQSLSLVEADVLRGRDMWRLTGIHETLPSMKFVETEFYPLLEKISSVLQRLCQGEDAHPELWQEIEHFFSLLQDSNSEHIKSIEIILLSRILYQLGYWSDDDMLVQAQDPYQQEMFDYVDANRIRLITKINESLKSSQL